MMNTLNLETLVQYSIAISSPVVGRWVSDTTFDSEYGCVECHEEYEFCADGTAAWYYRESDDMEANDDELELNESFRYSIDDKTVMMFSEKGVCDTAEYRFSDLCLTLYFSNTGDTVIFTKADSKSEYIEIN